MVLMCLAECVGSGWRSAALAHHTVSPPRRRAAPRPAEAEAENEWQGELGRAGVERGVCERREQRKAGRVDGDWVSPPPPPSTLPAAAIGGLGAAGLAPSPLPGRRRGGGRRPGRDGRARPVSASQLARRLACRAGPRCAPPPERACHPDDVRHHDKKLILPVRTRPGGSRQQDDGPRDPPDAPRKQVSPKCHHRVCSASAVPVRPACK